MLLQINRKSKIENRKSKIKKAVYTIVNGLFNGSADDYL